MIRLSSFIRTESAQILEAWDQFAATVSHGGKHMDQAALRDHAAELLHAIADDLDEPQSGAQGIAKSKGDAPRDPAAGDTAAETHADTRIVAGFAIDAMITEYRALRASVLRLWARAKGSETHADELQQLTRFNEAIDQAVAESVARYTEQVKRYTDLFMGMLGHDIRNPLGTIKLSTEVLVRSGQISRKAMEPIANSAERIQNIIELIVDFSRAQSDGVMPVRTSCIDLRAVAQDVVAETQVRHPGRELAVVSDGDLQGEWDGGRLSQLLSNLLENAISYGSRASAITLRLTGEADRVSLSVHNHGEPIPLGERERIFEPRSRGASSDERRSPDGMGLGLYICREITRAHGGALSVRSDASEGTTFLAQLPRGTSSLT